MNTNDSYKYNLYPLVEQVREIGNKHRLWTPGDCIVVAVSGGPDSVALLHIMRWIAASPEYNLSLVCAHVNHGFRPEESEEEAKFVRRMAKELGVPFEMVKLDIPAYMRKTGKGAQLAAREKRYEFLYDIARKYGAASIALAHHANDQAETVMMRLLRGSGPSGLAGIRMKRQVNHVTLIRPLLRLYKAELVAACEAAGIAYCVDNSNFSDKYTRNAIRLDVLPYLGQYNSQLIQSLNRLADTFAEEDDFMEQQTRQVFEGMVSISTESHELSLEAEQFASLHAALQRRLIKLILNYLPLDMEESDFIKIERIRQGIIEPFPTTWSYDLGDGLQCVREYGTIRFIPDAAGKNDNFSYTYCVDSIPAEVVVSALRLNLSFMQIEADRDVISDMLTKDHDKAIFDAQQLEFPLTVRNRKPGDAMKVMGLNGTKKVKDIFIDEKIPPSLRSRIPVVTDAQDRILWIPGIRRSSIAAVGPQTSSVVLMAMEKVNGGDPGNR